jgi:GAF domain-containing protein
MVHVTGLGNLCEPEAVSGAVVHPFGVERVGAPSAVIGGAPAEVVSELVRLGSTITATTMVDRALHLVTVLAKAAIDGADGVSVLLERGDRVSTVAWSNDVVLEMDLHQYQTGEGPCLDAAKFGQPFHSASLVEEERWPAFVRHARDQGIASIWSTPLTMPDRSVGALNIYSNTERALGDAQLTLAAMFAEQASGIIAASYTDQDAGARLAQALVDREQIAQAEGVLMARDGVSAVAAASLLFSAARAAELTVSEQAARVVASTGREARGE